VSPKSNFTLDEHSLASISNSLELLDMENVRLEQSHALYFLENVRTLNLKNNVIYDFQEEVSPFLITAKRLEKLVLTGNPVTKQTAKYRDKVVLLSSILVDLDDLKTITP